MDTTEESNLLNFARENGIVIELIDINNQKHPDFDSYLDVYRIRLSRKHESFMIEWGTAQLGLSDDEEITDAKLVCAVLTGLRKYDPGTFDEFHEQYGTGGPDPVERIRRIYEMEHQEYRNVQRLFSDILEDLRDVVSQNM